MVTNFRRKDFCSFGRPIYLRRLLVNFNSWVNWHNRNTSFQKGVDWFNNLPEQLWNDFGKVGFQLLSGVSCYRWESKSCTLKQRRPRNKTVQTKSAVYCSSHTTIDPPSATTSRKQPRPIKRPLNLCILDGRLLEVQLYLNPNPVTKITTVVVTVPLM